MRSPSSASGARRRGRTAVVVAALGLSVVAGACGGDSDTAADAAATGDGTPNVLTIADFAYAPEPLVVPKGTVVKVVNEDDAAHTATADDGSFDTGELGQGDSKEITLNDEGELAYHCTIHDYMRGVIRVSA
jgi:plastocyanin